MEAADDSVRLGPHSRRDALARAAGDRENLSPSENRFHSSENLRNSITNFAAGDALRPTNFDAKYLHYSRETFTIKSMREL
jgi:hypothetical protein